MVERERERERGDDEFVVVRLCVVSQKRERERESLVRASAPIAKRPFQFDCQLLPCSPLLLTSSTNPYIAFLIVYNTYIVLFEYELDTK
jgi:hypothetical protein